ncbi:helix-turn-helix transcriptional regulator [Weizmannia sp. CD-2023]|uniref:helix-turn-helix domain-containing protein n=1 Tax=Heyndrickxia TaxID=2837504 RepID=UPI002E213C7B|nr:helix-turn-helix transcriptional regulator [Weizmannia sp. CD-2023]MED4899787.1 helix-turn-helix transcriptional regulator [Weizmannia sp. CD-2023]
MSEPELNIKLKELLKEKNITQKELAEMTGLREATISEIANNARTTINKEQLLLIMKTLGVKELSKILELNWK